MRSGLGSEGEGVFFLNVEVSEGDGYMDLSIWWTGDHTSKCLKVFF